MNYASRPERLMGQLLDGVVGVAPLLVGLFLIDVAGLLALLLMLGGYVWLVFYIFFADGFPGGQSFGKKWMGMRVVDSRTGKPCSFWQSFIRNLLLAFLGPIDWLFIFGAKHQRLGDKAAHTFVLGDDKEGGGA